MGHNLQGVRVGVLAADGFEQIELTSPVKSLKKHGAGVEIISLKSGSIRGMNLILPGKKVEVDHTIDQVTPERYDALLIPGGFVNPDMLRQNKQVLEFVRTFSASGKPMALICHAPWVLVSAGLVSGRSLTSWPGIKDDIINAGGDWEDKAVVHDSNWITSRGPQDLPKFNAAIAKFFAEHANRSLPIVEKPAQPALGRWLLGALAVAGIGYAARRFAPQPQTELTLSNTHGTRAL